MTPQRNLLSSETESSFYKYLPERCQVLGCVVALHSTHTRLNHEGVVLTHYSSGKGMTSIDIPESMLRDSAYDIWGQRITPWLNKQHPEYLGLEMNG